MAHLARTKRSLLYASILITLLLYISFHLSNHPLIIFQFLVDQPDSHPYESSCNFPILQDEDPSLLKSIKHSGTPSPCPLVYPLQVVNRSIFGFFLISTSSSPRPFSCSVQILSGTLYPNVRSMNISTPVDLPQNKHFYVNEDTFVITCSEENKKNKSEIIFSRVYMGVKLKESPELILEVEKEEEEGEVDERAFDVKSMSISILVFDSTSRSQFARHMKQSKKLMDEMGFVTLLGYNKVGDNSAPNLSPILAEPYKESIDYDNLDETGDIALNKFLPYKQKIDPDTIDFLWNRMKNTETLFNDDIMHQSRGLFHYSAHHFKPGFSKKPTDHYYRPFHNHFYKMLNNKWKMCWDGILFSEQLLIPWFLSLRKLSDRRFFSFNFLTSPSHDNPNTLESVDEGLSKRLTALKNSGSLSNSLLIIMGDHGQRMHHSQQTFGGRIEERQPMMSILLPREFRVHYPDAFKNLQINVNRLTSNVDIHETLLDIVDNRFGKERPKGRGRSLFTPIPSNRSCMEAWIPKNFCLCQYNSTEEDRKLSSYSHSSSSLLSSVSKHLRSFKCLLVETLHCKDTYSLYQPHKSARIGMRSKANWTTRMKEVVAPKGYHLETTCTIRSHRNLPLSLLVRSRVSGNGTSHSIPYSPMIIKGDGECGKIKNIGTFCTCESAFGIHSSIESKMD